VRRKGGNYGRYIEKDEDADQFGKLRSFHRETHRRRGENKRSQSSATKQKHKLEIVAAAEARAIQEGHKRMGGTNLQRMKAGLELAVLAISVVRKEPVFVVRIFGVRELERIGEGEEGSGRRRRRRRRSSGYGSSVDVCRSCRIRHSHRCSLDSARLSTQKSILLLRRLLRLLLLLLSSSSSSSSFFFFWVRNMGLCWRF
jgi:hypothetical protein